MRIWGFSWFSQRSRYFQHSCWRVQQHCDRRETRGKLWNPHWLVRQRLTRLKERDLAGSKVRVKTPQDCPHNKCNPDGPRGIGNGPNTVSESMASKTELSEFFGPHRVPGRELSEFLSAFFFGVKMGTHWVYFTELAEFATELSEFSIFRNSTLETVFRPFPRVGGMQRLGHLG